MVRCLILLHGGGVGGVRVSGGKTLKKKMVTTIVLSASTILALISVMVFPIFYFLPQFQTDMEFPKKGEEQ